MKVPAEELTTALQRAGVGRLFGVTGGGMSLALATAADAVGLTYVPVAHEASAGVMAGAFSRTSETLGAAVSIKGPGFANLLPSVAFASLEGRPLLTLSEAYDSDAPPWLQHKRLAHQAMATPVLRGFTTASDFVAAPNPWAQAAQSEIPGPVHVELADSQGDGIGPPAPGPSAPAGNMASIVARVEGARRPVVIAGDLATRRTWSRLLSRLKIPVFTSVAAKGAIDESLPHAAGPFTGRGGPLTAEIEILDAADVVVGLGVRAHEILGADVLGDRWILIDEVDDPLALIGEVTHLRDGPGDAVSSLLDILVERDAWADEMIQRSRSRFRQTVLEGPWAPGPAMSIVSSTVPDASLVLDTGHFCTIAEHAWVTRRPGAFLGASCSRWMGTAFASSIGLAMSTPRPVVCAVGDGGWPNVLLEARLPISHDLPLCIVLFSDGRFGSVASSTSVAGPLLSALEVDLSDPARVMSALGYEAVTASTAEQMEIAMRSWSKDRPHFVWARFDPGTYLAHATDVRR